MKLQTKDYETLDEGEYSAKLTGYEEKEGDFGPFLLLTFSVLDEEHAGSTVTAMASKKLGPKCKLRGYVEGMLGRALESKEMVDMDDFIDRKYMIYVGVKDTDTGLFNVVEKIRLPKRKAAPKPVVEDEEEEEEPVKSVKNGKRQPMTEAEGAPF